MHSLKGDIYIIADDRRIGDHRIYCQKSGVFRRFSVSPIYWRESFFQTRYVIEYGIYAVYDSAGAYGSAADGVHVAFEGKRSG